MSRSKSKMLRMWDSLEKGFSSPAKLRTWVKMYLHLLIPARPVCPHHRSPLDYLWHAYHEPAKDLVVWAPRGGGKTRLAAVATLLDMMHKPAVAVRILGGSLDQSLRMWEHLVPDAQRVSAHLLMSDGRNWMRRLELTNGSHAAVLTQSQRAVRGLRVQKLRCDEVEMFDADIWEAAQLVTRSQNNISGAIEALSTAHSPGGLMSRVIENAKKHGTRIIHWCMLDVLERCAPERDCKTCPLWDECKGIAKTKCDGFFSIDDAIAMKKRVSVETWEAEMLCRKPVQQRGVFPTFDKDLHVVERDPGSSSRSLAMDFGFAMPFVCLWIETRADGTTFVFDEYVQEQRTTAEHIDHIETRPWGKVRVVACDPAGAGRNSHTAASDIQLLRSRGYCVKARKSQIVPGLDLIRNALRPAHGSPRLFMHPRCVHLIKAMGSYHYGKTGTELPVKDGEHDHLIDALRYHFVNAQLSGEVKVRSY